MRYRPPDDADELAWLLFRQEGVLSRQQAMRHITPSRLRHLVASGRWSRPHRGVFVAHNGPVGAAQRLWIGSLAAGTGRPAPVAGLTALAVQGLRGYETGLVHVYVPRPMEATSVPPYVRIHRGDVAGAELRRGNPPRTSPARSVIDAARWLRSDEQARAIITASFQQRLVDGDALAEVLARMPRVRHRGLIGATISDASGGCESLAEHDFLLLCRRAHLPIPSRQSPAVDSAGRRRYRDAYFEEWGVHVEIDGARHMEIRSWWADMRRQNVIGIHGDRVLRFPAWALRHDPETVIAQLRAALVAAGWRPSGP